MRCTGRQPAAVRRNSSRQDQAEREAQPAEAERRQAGGIVSRRERRAAGRATQAAETAGRCKKAAGCRPPPPAFLR